MRNFPASIGLGFGIGLHLLRRQGYDLTRFSQTKSYGQPTIGRTSSTTEREVTRESDILGELEHKSSTGQSGVVERKSSYTQG